MKRKLSARVLLKINIKMININSIANIICSNKYTESMKLNPWGCFAKYGIDLYSKPQYLLNNMYFHTII